LEPLDKSFDLAGISEETGGIRAEDAQLSKNVDWYNKNLQENQNTITIWGHHDGSSEVGVLDYWKSMSLQQDGSIDIG
jgi:hypothetical protein